MNALNGLFREALERLHVSYKIRCIDETVELVKPEALYKKLKSGFQKVLVGLVGVQTNQFPRAADLAVRFKKAGAMVIMGGFHVSGTKALIGDTPEVESLKQQGISLFLGEAEGRIDEIITDAVNGQLQPEYSCASKPDLTQDWALPLVDTKISKRYAVQHNGTMDTSRGCPFNCSFCTIIHVQGNRMRFRDPDIIEKHIRTHYPSINFYFFTDDNMSRNPHWPDIFNSLIKMREKEHMNLKFMMQADVPSFKIPGFVELAKRAGCTEVFIGLESLNADNLKAAGKSQNHTEVFQEMVKAWHDSGISVHTAYIIGFPYDTQASVKRDVKRLTDEIEPDQASFFMLTPLPGSVDHLKKLEQNEWMSSDLNDYDSFHAVTNHPLMSVKEWTEAYSDAFSTFYSYENLVKILSRANPANYWRIFKNAAWYRNSWFTEEAHPMITGFWRLKGRLARRPMYPTESRLAYFRRRWHDTMTYISRLNNTVSVMERLWRDTWLTKHNKDISNWFSKGVGDNEVYRCVRRNFVTKLVSLNSSILLHFGSASERWKRIKTLYTTRWLINPELYLRSIWASILSVCELLTRRWLFVVNFILET